MLMLRHYDFKLIETGHKLSEESQKSVEAFEALDTDAKLAVFYFVYEEWATPLPQLPCCN